MASGLTSFFFLQKSRPQGYQLGHQLLLKVLYSVDPGTDVRSVGVQWKCSQLSSIFYRVKQIERNPV
jgi:hypothetical protein